MPIYIITLTKTHNIILSYSFDTICYNISIYRVNGGIYYYFGLRSETSLPRNFYSMREVIVYVTYVLYLIE